ncbi:hypothetical protein [Clostridium chromiireducens]|uniref:Uncharacterized protein n=1 Tax=Clostridium chromiireducens TaxID=225345 RepID=A0A1V4IV25_9CLOT|nr:hypothetical protein [Clostridium chromiireducens]OPJ63670.1 hypothetical protein CLCHR_14850 [Clostridium chromiireducens]
MNQIAAKIYYLIKTGEVLAITSEMQGCVESTTKEQDMQTHDKLKTHDIDEIDFVELEYGTLVNTFKNIKSYSVDVDNKVFVPVYYTEEELKSIEQQTQNIKDLNTRVSDISDYLSNDNTELISKIEDLIIQSELDKLLN